MATSDSYDQLSKQIERVLNRLDSLSDTFRDQISGLDAKYATKSELQSASELLSQRQDGYERQMDVKLVGYDDEFRSMQDAQQYNRRMLWGAVASTVSTVVVAVVITLLGVHS